MQADTIRLLWWPSLYNQIQNNWSRTHAYCSRNVREVIIEVKYEYPIKFQLSTHLEKWCFIKCCFVVVTAVGLSWFHYSLLNTYIDIYISLIPVRWIRTAVYTSRVHYVAMFCSLLFQNCGGDKLQIHWSMQWYSPDYKLTSLIQRLLCYVSWF